MKLFAVGTLVPLLFVGLVRGQVPPICSHVKNAGRLLEAAKIAADPDLRAALAACDAPANPAALERSLAALHLTPQRLFAWMDPAAASLTGRDLFDWLPVLAKAALRAEELDKAQSDARELLQMAPQYTRERNYGDAIYDGYSVMGRVALRRQNVPLAKQYLLNAATSPGSPVLDENGPDMTLAKELLERGQAPVVLQFFVLCREFWKTDNGRLAEWSASVRRHELPNFGSSLDY